MVADLIGVLSDRSRDLRTVYHGVISDWGFCRYKSLNLIVTSKKREVVKCGRVINNNEGF